MTIALLAFVACSSAGGDGGVGPGDSGLDASMGTTDDQETSSSQLSDTSTGGGTGGGPFGATYALALELDGMTETLGTSTLHLVESSGPDCAASTSLYGTVESVVYHHPAYVELTALGAFGVGAGGGLGSFAEPGHSQSIWLLDGSTYRQVSSPGWVVTDFGPDVLRIEFEAGEVCVMPAESTSQPCMLFAGGSLTFVAAESDASFANTATHCSVDPLTDGGDMCALHGDIETCP